MACPAHAQDLATEEGGATETWFPALRLASETAHSYLAFSELAPACQLCYPADSAAEGLQP